ncbi:MAG: SDR family NAD(P)-dependent oxidoreductase [Saezia sp.]
MPVVLVTGAGRRLGKEIALALGREKKWDVAVHHGMSQWPAHEVIDQLREMGVKAHAFSADLGNEQECRALLPQVIEKMGSVHAIVNNASIFEDDTAQTFTYQRLMRHMAVNTAPAIILAQGLYEHVKAAAEGQSQDDFIPGVVVNMLDQKLWSLNPDYLSYTLSKAALEAANEMLALQLAPFVRTVGVAPGFTLPTPTMTDKWTFDRLHKMSPLGKSSTAEEVVQTVLFAIQNRALTGTSLVVDGGQHLMRMPRDISKL